LALKGAVCTDISIYPAMGGLIPPRRGKVRMRDRPWIGRIAINSGEGLTTNGVSNDVSFIDLGALKVIKSIPIGSFPWDVAISKQ
jgi:YVTN family beta-propeller protein